MGEGTAPETTSGVRGASLLPSAALKSHPVDRETFAARFRDAATACRDFASQYLEYSTGKRADQLDGCDAQAAAKAFGASGYKIDDLVLAVVGMPSFITRRN